MKKIAIVNCTYRDYPEIVKFVNSVRSNKYGLEFYIHDNTAENLGYSPGMNEGIQKGYNNGCDYYYVGNADTELYPDFLDTIIPLLDKNPKYLFLSGTREDEVIQEIVNGDLDSVTLDENGLKVYLENQQKNTAKMVSYDPDFAAFVFTRKAIDIIQEFDRKSFKKYETKGFLFDERYYPLYFEDNDLKTRVYLAGYKIGKVNTAIFKHEVSHTIKTDTEFSQKNNETFRNNMIAYCQKYSLFDPSQAEWRTNKPDLSDFQF